MYACPLFISDHILTAIPKRTYREMARKKAKFIVGFAIIGVCLLYLVVSEFQETAMYYLTVTELEAKESEFLGKRVKLAGRVVPGSIEIDSETLAVSFRIWEPLEDGVDSFSEAMAIRYKGIVPDTFRDGSDVVLEGKPKSTGAFKAETLLAKCPSKYEGKSYEKLKQTYR